jgi:hypothetical protein
VLQARVASALARGSAMQALGALDEPLAPRLRMRRDVRAASGHSAAGGHARGRGA